jgi:TonB family protein
MNPFRRNFIIAAIVHVVFVGGLVAWELFAPRLSHSVPTPVEIIVPPPILGDSRKGPGVGRGAYAPPAPTPVPSPAPAMPTGAADETPAPTPSPTPVAPVRSTADEVSIPRKTTTPPKKTTTTATPTKPKTGSTTKVASATPSGVASAEQIRQRFLKAAGNGEAGGTPYGDGRSAGGGSGNGKIGSPDGSPNGVVGGVGAGSPNWEYYQHVHDRMYEAWEQPSTVQDRQLATTLLLKVGRDGRIAGVSVYRSSGNKLMDDSALTAARKVNLLEPPPAPLLKGTEAAITVVFQVEG